ncbi:cyanocobalamin reductase / alkylcobalamin dealkylase isoform X2 [Octopus sinensis]|uniref:Cyanocobalamin reductase (cyanide-eliminating) n=1 Tax=Octopus sinensis TaxID=2607531 RepID=A0A7E6EMC9_9MOLL|nr:cyanocobalamin reductase / alkylcobalamin dealkylase isoform X2 [Octopus sinensis]
MPVCVCVCQIYIYIASRKIYARRHTKLRNIVEVQLSLLEILDNCLQVTIRTESSWPKKQKKLFGGLTKSSAHLVLRRIPSKYVKWYNELVGPNYQLEYHDDTFALITISTPQMFEKAFKPFIYNIYKKGDLAPIDHCVKYYTEEIKTTIFGISIHPQYGGWFAIRAAIIFKNLKFADLKKKDPVDAIPDQETRIKLLNMLNEDWEYWKARDIIKVSERYTEEAINYFKTLPKDRYKLIEDMQANRKNNA